MKVFISACAPEKSKLKTVSNSALVSSGFIAFSAFRISGSIFDAASLTDINSSFNSDTAALTAFVSRSATAPRKSPSGTGRISEPFVIASVPTWIL